MTARNLLLLLPVLLAPTPGRAAADCARATLTVASWNVNGSKPVEGRKVDHVADGLLALDADVVVLSEVAPDQAIEALSAALSRRGLEYEYVLLEQRAPQNIAVMYKPWVELRRAELVDGSDDGAPSLRKALAVEARAADFDFLLIALYLRSGRSADAAATRVRQASAIASFLRAALPPGGEDDALVVGDYNMDPGRERRGFDALASGVRLRFLSSEALAGSITHIRRCEPRRGLLLDGFGVTEGAYRQYIPGTLHVAPMDRFLAMSCAEYVREVSDQLPIQARFRVLGDND